MKVKAAIFDIDKTITSEDSFFLFFKFLLIRFRPLVYLKLLYFFLETRLFKTDRIIVKATVLELLDGLSEDEIQELCLTFIEKKFKEIISDKAQKTLRECRENGYMVLLISASLDVYLKYINECIEFDHLICTRTKREGMGVTIKGKNCYADEKVVRLNEFLLNEKIDLDFEKSQFYTDHHSDLPLLKLVGQPFVVNGNAKLLNFAKKNNWQILDWK